MIAFLRHAWDRLSLYLPVVLMGLLALSTWWLVRNAPQPQDPRPATALRHEPDYQMNGVSVRSFAPAGRLQTEVLGAVARHYPDTDTLEISNVTLRGQNPNGQRNDVFSANNMQLNSKSGEYELTGQVRGVIAPGKP